MNLNWSDWLEIQAEIGEEVVVREFKKKGVDPWEDAGSDTIAFIPEAQDRFNDVADEIQQLCHQVVGELGDEVEAGLEDFMVTKAQEKELIEILTSGFGFNVKPFFKIEPRQNGKRGPGKFADDLDAAIYQLSLDGGPDEEVGSSDSGFGWYGLMLAGDFEHDLHAAGLEISPDERVFLREQQGAIMHEISDGSVNIEWYEDELELKQDWDSLVKEHEEEFADEEEG